MTERDNPPKRAIVDIRVKKEAEFPADPENRFEAVFSAIGNSEAKCLTLLCLSQSPLTGQDLHNRFLALSGKVWKTDRKLQANYCVATLIPIGLVVEADTLYHGSMEYVAGFRLTNEGTKYGQPIAAFLLEKSQEFPFSLLKIFSQTSTGPGETRSVINRVKILEYLYQEDEVSRQVDIINQIVLNQHSAGSHLTHLAELGLIEYSSVSSEDEGFDTRILSPEAQKEDVKTVAYRPKLTFDVAQILFESGTVNTILLTRNLKDKYPNWSFDSLRRSIAEVLLGLEKQGLCYPKLFVASKIQSQAKITDLGRSVVSEIVLPIRKALAEGNDLLSQWERIPWENYAKMAISKYREASGHAQPCSLEENVDKAQAIIFQNPGIRTKELISMLGTGSNRPLKILLEHGKIRKEREGFAVRHYPV